MADKAHIETDERLEEMERHLSAIFSRAQKETGKAWKKYLKESGEKIAELQKDYDKAKDSGDAELIRKAGYELGRAKRGQTLQNKRFKDLTEQTAQQILHINETALAYINGELPAIYALNYNALEPQVENIGGYSFTLTDPETVKNLATKDETLLPYKIMDGKKDVRWNTKKINAEVLQGILQGESMDKIAGRLSKVLDMDKTAAIRNARTTVTSAECKGRQDSYIRAKDDGIQLQREWVSAIDKRTRHAHVMLNGQIAEIEKPFHSELGKIMYPGDPEADPANVYNCRCTLVARVLGFKKQTTVKKTKEDAKNNRIRNVPEQDEVFKVLTGKNLFSSYDEKVQGQVNSAVYEKLGIGDPPTVVESLGDRKVYYRGISNDAGNANDYFDQLKSGKLYTSASTSGNGINFAKQESEAANISFAKDFATMNGKTDGIIVESAFDESMKLVKFSDLDKMIEDFKSSDLKKQLLDETQKLANDFQNEAFEKMDKSLFEQGKAFSTLNKMIDENERGIVAVLNGFDGVNSDVWTECCIFNRSKLIIKKDAMEVGK